MANFKAIIVGTAGIPATCTITSDESEFTDATPFEIQIEFSSAVTGFVVGDITINNATLSNFSGSGTSYTADVTPDLAGDITISVAENVTTEGNSVSNTVTVTDNVPVDLLLDTYNNADVACGLVKLDKDYAGSCIRVRRSSDDAEQDIGFSGDSLDTSALTSFVGANTGYVTKWYDQSGNGNDLAESGKSLQPIIVTSGTIETDGGLPAIKQTGNLRLWTSTASFSSTSTVFSVASMSVGSRIFLTGELVNQINRFIGFAVNADGQPSHLGAGTPSMYVNNSAIGSTRGDLYTAINLSQSILAFENCNFSTWNYYVTDYFTTSFQGYDLLQALVIFTDDKSADRSDICDYFNDIYSCY